MSKKKTIKRSRKRWYHNPKRLKNYISLSEAMNRLVQIAVTEHQCKSWCEPFIFIRKYHLNQTTIYHLFLTEHSAWCENQVLRLVFWFIAPPAGFKWDCVTKRQINNKRTNRESVHPHAAESLRGTHPVKLSLYFVNRHVILCPSSIHHYTVSSVQRETITHTRPNSHCHTYLQI